MRPYPASVSPLKRSIAILHLYDPVRAQVEQHQPVARGGDTGGASNFIDDAERWGAIRSPGLQRRVRRRVIACHVVFVKYRESVQQG